MPRGQSGPTCRPPTQRGASNVPPPDAKRRAAIPVRDRIHALVVSGCRSKYALG
jgi:hypothetical protein